jgi:uncharacterized membrane protein YedE/YeeE
MGRGLGASGAFASAAAATAVTASPDAARANDYFARYLSSGGGAHIDWLVVELIGVTLGGFASAFFSGRFSVAIEKGPRITNNARVRNAAVGGAIMGVGAVLARGCTSGQALTGGATLNVGSWLFIGGAFAAAYLAAPLLRKAWV